MIFKPKKNFLNILLRLTKIYPIKMSAMSLQSFWQNYFEIFHRKMKINSICIRKILNWMNESLIIMIQALLMHLNFTFYKRYLILTMILEKNRLECIEIQTVMIC